MYLFGCFMLMFLIIIVYLKFTLIFDSSKLKVMLGLHLQLSVVCCRLFNHDGGGVLGHQGCISDGHDDFQYRELFQMRVKSILKLTQHQTGTIYGKFWVTIFTVGLSYRIFVKK